MRTSDHTTPAEHPTWAALLEQAVSQPGSIHAAYTAFHAYSVGNQILALCQCRSRDLQPGPIATYNGWREKGRQVKRGEAAITLCQPRTFTTKARDDDEDDGGHTYRRFVYRRLWFVLVQTEGEDAEPESVPGWNPDQAMATLGFTRVSFDHTDGNTQGYCTPAKKQIAINPVAAMPTKTLIHEMAHCLLHGDDADHQDGATLPRSLKETEAEAVALIVAESIGIDGADYCRGYIQDWLGTNPIPEANAQRIFKAADTILKAGQTVDVHAEIARLKRENARLAART